MSDAAAPYIQRITDALLELSRDPKLSAFEKLEAWSAIQYAMRRWGEHFSEEEANPPPA